MPSEGLVPPLIATIPVKERKRGVLIDLIKQWKKPYPHGLGGGMDFLLDELVTGPGKALDTMPYADFALLFHIIEERYRQVRRRKQPADEKAMV